MVCELRYEFKRAPDGCSGDMDDFFFGIAMAGFTRANREIAGHFPDSYSGDRARAGGFGHFGAHFRDRYVIHTLEIRGYHNEVPSRRVCRFYIFGWPGWQERIFFI